MKRIKIAFLLCLGFSFTQLNAQQNPIKITRKVNADRSVELEYEKPDPGSYTLVFRFREMTNSSGSETEEISIKNYSGVALTVKPLDKDKPVNFSYTYFTFRGKLSPKYSPDFIYRLPYLNGTRIKVAEVGFLNAKYFGSTTPDDWKVYRFYTENENPVVAVRKGTVVDIKDLHENNDAEDVSYTSKTNEVIIEHADGTLATYKGFKKGSIPLKIGQTVFPSTVLGLNSKNNSGGRFGVLLSITYLKSVDTEARKKGLKESKSNYGFVSPKFFTAESPNTILMAQQEYTAGDTVEILQKELSKKEIKQLAKP
jgi:hypothetical protein